MEIQCHYYPISTAIDSLSHGRDQSSHMKEQTLGPFHPPNLPPRTETFAKSPSGAVGMIQICALAKLPVIVLETHSTWNCLNQVN